MFKTTRLSKFLFSLLITLLFSEAAMSAVCDDAFSGVENRCDVSRLSDATSSSIFTNRAQLCAAKVQNCTKSCVTDGSGSAGNRIRCKRMFSMFVTKAMKMCEKDAGVKGSSTCTIMKDSIPRKTIDKMMKVKSVKEAAISPVPAGASLVATSSVVLKDADLPVAPSALTVDPDEMPDGLAKALAENVSLDKKDGAEPVPPKKEGAPIIDTAGAEKRKRAKRASLDDTTKPGSSDTDSSGLQNGDGNSEQQPSSNQSGGGQQADGNDFGGSDGSGNQDAGSDSSGGGGGSLLSQAAKLIDGAFSPSEFSPSESSFEEIELGDKIAAIQDAEAPAAIMQDRAAFLHKVGSGTDPRGLPDRLKSKGGGKGSGARAPTPPRAAAPSSGSKNNARRPGPRRRYGAPQKPIASSQKDKFWKAQGTAQQIAQVPDESPNRKQKLNNRKGSAASIPTDDQMRQRFETMLVNASSKIDGYQNAGIPSLLKNEGLGRYPGVFQQMRYRYTRQYRSQKIGY